VNPLEFYLRTLLRGVQGQFVALAQDLSGLPLAFIREFPSLLGMLNVLVEFGTSLVARLVAIPFTGLETYIQDLLKLGKLNNKLIRVDDAVHIMFVAYTTFVQTITNTGSNNLATWLAQTAALWVWRTFKHWKFIWKLTKIQNESQLVNLYISKFRSRLAFLKVVSLILGGFIVLAWAGAQLLMIGIGIMLFDGSFQALVLPQDSKRIRKNVKRQQFRQNARRGADKA